MLDRLTHTVVVLVSIALVSSLSMAFVSPEALAQGARQDKRNDLIRACTGEPVSQNLAEEAGFIDIVQASALVDSETNNLIMRLKTAEPIPTQSSNLVSYSFLMDLDGEETGFVGDKAPLGVFSGLGIDLWVSYSYYENERGVYGFLGSPNIPNLKSRTNLVDYQIKDNRQTLEFTVPIEQIETVLKIAYLHVDPSWEVEPDEMEWVTFTNWTSSDDPVSDFLPKSYYEQSSRECLKNPLVEQIKEEKAAKEDDRGGDDEDEDDGGGDDEDEDDGGGSDGGGDDGDEPAPPPPPPPPGS